MLARVWKPAMCLHWQIHSEFIIVIISVSISTSSFKRGYSNQLLLYRVIFFNWPNPLNLLGVGPKEAIFKKNVLDCAPLMIELKMLKYLELPLSCSPYLELRKLRKKSWSLIRKGRQSPFQSSDFATEENGISKPLIEARFDRQSFLQNCQQNPRRWFQGQAFTWSD